MSRLCRIDLERREALLGELRAFVTRLGRAFPLREVWLFGSFARGEPHEGSDIDLLIVGRVPGRLFDRIESVLALTDLPIEPLIYTPEEFNLMRAEGNPLVVAVLETGTRLL